MRLALREAAEAARRDEVPVVAVVVRDRTVLGRAHNQIEMLRDPTAHAEMIVITQAAEALGSPRLVGTTLYVTLEPCAMCAGAAVLGRIDRIVYGAADPKTGACGSVLRVAGEERLNHRPRITGGVLGEEAGEMLRAFFRRKRLADDVARRDGDVPESLPGEGSDVERS